MGSSPCYYKSKDMSKVTSKLRLTLPKAIAVRFGIKHRVHWEAAGDTIRVVPATGQGRAQLDPGARLRLFDQATSRQRKREGSFRAGELKTAAREGKRGWTREDLYRRGRAR